MGEATVVSPSRPSARVSWLTAATIGYLALPLVLFFVTWLRLPYAVVLVAVVAVGMLPFVPGRPHLTRLHLNWQVVAGVTVLAGWVAISGPLSFVHANFDWWKHDAVFNDLLRREWPVTYLHNEAGDSVVLRYYLGWYLVPAALGKVFGHGLTQYFVFLWTLAGVLLVVGNVVQLVRSTWHKALAIGLFILFSGLDIVGGLITGNPGRVALGVHVEQWATYFSYDSNTTQLFWAPQHVLPGWIFGVLAFRFWKEQWFARTLLIVLALLPFWSPITAVGALPIAAVIAVHHWRHGNRRLLFSVSNLVSAPLIVIALGLFLGQHLGGNPAGFSWEGHSFWAVAGHYVLFTALEVGVPLVIAVLLGPLRQRPLLIMSIAVLMILPLFKVGVFNDTAMRTSIVPLTILTCCMVSALGARPTVNHRKITVVFVGVLLVGTSLTPAQELARVVIDPPQEPATWGVLDEMGLLSAEVPESQYLATVDSPVVEAMLKQHRQLYEVGAPLDWSNVQWSFFCECDHSGIIVKTDPLSLSSDKLVDAWFSSSKALSPGLYQIEADFTYDLKESPRSLSVDMTDRSKIAHLSVFNQTKIATIDAGQGRKHVVQWAYVADRTGASPLAFGLGGWGESRGFVELDNLVIRPVITIPR